MSRRDSLRCVLPARAKLGECPLWSPSEGVLYWIDIEGRSVHRFDPSTGVDESRVIAARPGSIGLTGAPGVLLMGSENLIGFFEFGPGELHPLLELDSVPAGVRLNDGRCDPAGRYWTGSMYEDPKANRFEGFLYCVDADGSSTIAQERVGVSNGIAFSPEGTTMYFADTLCETVWSYDYDLETGYRRNKRVFTDFADLPGKPDGACIDETGCYWIACIHGSAIARLTPNGVVDRIIKMPVDRPTMPAFGGSDLTTLFITSIRMGTAHGPQPESGGLFALEPGVAGLAEPTFGADPADFGAGT